MTRVAFRVDLLRSLDGINIKRCLALAGALVRNSADVVFVTEEVAGNSKLDDASLGVSTITLTSTTAGPDDAAVPLESSGPLATSFSQIDDADRTIAALVQWCPNWIVVDHEMIDSRWHRKVAAALGARICVIDKLADRDICADILIDDTEIDDHRQKFGRRLASTVRILGGPRYSLNNDDRAVPQYYQFSQRVHSVGVVVSESDMPEAVYTAIRGCRDVASYVGKIEIAIPVGFANRAAISELAVLHDATVVETDSVQLAAFYSRHDLHVVAVTDPSWERYHVGVPTVGLRGASETAASKIPPNEVSRAIVEGSSEAIGTVLGRLINSAAERRNLARSARRELDERGPKRIALALMANELRVTAAQPSHARRAFRWRIDERVRKYSRDPRPFSLPSHINWWTHTLNDPKRNLLIATCGQTEVGVVRLDVEARRAELSVYMDPNLTGSGLGVSLLKVTQRWAAANLPLLCEITAFVFPENFIAILAFRASGFVQISETSWRFSLPAHLVSSARETSVRSVG